MPDEQPVKYELQPWWVQTVKVLGFNTIVAICFMYAFWILGNKIADAHIRFLDNQIANSVKLTSALEQQTTILGRIDRGQDKLIQLLENQTLIINKLNEK